MRILIDTEKQTTSFGGAVITAADIPDEFSPDGFTKKSGAQYAADILEIVRVADLIKAAPEYAAGPGKTPEDWIVALVAEDARWRGVQNQEAKNGHTPGDQSLPGDQPNWPLGPYGVHYVDEALHDNGPASPFAAGTAGWEMEDPSANVWNWNGAPPGIQATMPDWLKPIMAQLKLQTLPGWLLGWGPVKK
jgi:hypothetical protein